MWSRLWSKNSKLTTPSLNVMMFLHLVFSLNYLILPWVRTWHPFLCWWNRWKAFFNLMPFCFQSHPSMWGVFSLLFLAYMWWCLKDKLWTNYGIWIVTRYHYKKSNSCRLFLMGMFCLKYCQCFRLLTTLPKCKAWIESMMTMLGVS